MTLVLVALALLGVAVVALSLRDDPRGPQPTGGAAPAAGSSSSTPASASPDDGAVPAISVEAPPEVVEPMTPVRLSGTVRGAAPGSSLTVQSSSGAGPWTTFPLHPAVDGQGRFRTFVELGASGVHRLRVVEPSTGATSQVMVVRVE